MKDLAFLNDGGAGFVASCESAPARLGNLQGPLAKRLSIEEETKPQSPAFGLRRYAYVACNSFSRL
jgi:hypothetical protein